MLPTICSYRMSDSEPEKLDDGNTLADVTNVDKPRDSDHDSDAENVQIEATNRRRGRSARKSDQEGLKIDDEIARLMKKAEDDKKKLMDQVKKLEDEKKKLKLQVKKGETDAKANQENVNQLNDKLEEAQSEIKTLSEQLTITQSKLNDKEDEMNDLNRLVIERDEEISDLMTQLVKTNESTDSTTQKPLGLAIVDEISKPIVSRLSQKVEWEICSDSNWIAQASTVDICVIIFGSEQIYNNSNSFQIFKLIKELVASQNRTCELVVVAIPVHKQKPQSIQMKLLNFQLAELAKESTNNITFVNPRAPREDLYDDNNALLDKTVALWASAINADMSIPKARNRAGRKIVASNIDETEMVSLIVQVPKEAIGPIIGKKGYNIRELTSEYDVKMSVGKWFERGRGSTQDYTERSDAIVITGELCKAQKSAAKIRQMATENAKTPVDEPEAKKFKF